MAENDRMEVLDELNEVRDTLGFIAYLLECDFIPGFSDDACFVREVTRLVQGRSR